MLVFRYVKEIKMSIQSIRFLTCLSNLFIYQKFSLCPLVLQVSEFMLCQVDQRDLGIAAVHLSSRTTHLRFLWLTYLPTLGFPSLCFSRSVFIFYVMSSWLFLQLQCLSQISDQFRSTKPSPGYFLQHTFQVILLYTKSEN